MVTVDGPDFFAAIGVKAVVPCTTTEFLEMTFVSNGVTSRTDRRGSRRSAAATRRIVESLCDRSVSDPDTRADAAAQRKG